MHVMMSEQTPLFGGRRPARPLFAIGDIHAYLKPLNVLLRRLGDVIDETYPDQAIDLVYLGDYIDRGPDPLDVLTRISQGLGRSRVTETALMGNHDHFLLCAAGLAGRKTTVTDWATWMSNGGRATLAAIGLSNPLTASAAQLREALRPETCAFLEGLKLSFETGDILCVHAGIDPVRPLDEQIEHDLIWVREPFLELAKDEEAPWTLGKTVVHGHSPHGFGAFAHRIGVDSGGYRTGVFTAAEIWDGMVRFHHVDVNG